MWKLTEFRFEWARVKKLSIISWLKWISMKGKHSGDIQLSRMPSRPFWFMTWFFANFLFVYLSLTSTPRIRSKSWMIVQPASDVLRYQHSLLFNSYEDIVSVPKLNNRLIGTEILNENVLSHRYIICEIRLLRTYKERWLFYAWLNYIHISSF